jgi:hypothetical protein
MFDEDSKVYKLFISHIDKEDEEYDLFLDKLSASYDLQWSDMAVRDKFLPEEITQQMKPADVVIILSGLCSKDKALITRQIDVATELKKPIVVIRPYGLENVSAHLERIAAEVVGWNTPCIVDAIKEALQEDHTD